MPVDILQPLLAARHLDEYTLLIVDEFPKLNGVEEHVVEGQRANLEATLDALGTVFEFHAHRLRTSAFMGTEAYAKTLTDVKEAIHDRHLEGALRATIPERHRERPGAEQYPLHEVACVAYLAAQGFETKVGPSRERLYDAVIEQLGIPIGFAYLHDAYALATPRVEPVVHYSPSDRASGQRLFLDDTVQAAKQKVMMSNDTAAGALASIGAHASGAAPPPSYGKRLRKEAARLVETAILQPYRVVR